MIESQVLYFVPRQAGAEAALKAGSRRSGRRSWRFAFSRPGFVTFKLPSEAISIDRFESPRLDVRARRSDLSIAKLETSEDPANVSELVEQYLECSTLSIRQFYEKERPALHVWQRDAHSFQARGRL